MAQNSECSHQHRTKHNKSQCTASTETINEKKAYPACNTRVATRPKISTYWWKNSFIVNAYRSSMPCRHKILIPLRVLLTYLVFSKVELKCIKRKNSTKNTVALQQRSELLAGFLSTDTYQVACPTIYAETQCPFFLKVALYNPHLQIIYCSWVS